MKVYLDVCCLNRPFDDASQGRVVVESAAIIRLFEKIDSRKLTYVSSDMARIEIDRTPDPDRRRQIRALLPPRSSILSLNLGILSAAERLVDVGFTLADATHLAAAKELKADVFLTVDDKLLRRAARHRNLVGVRVMNPVTFLRDLEDDDDR